MARARSVHTAEASFALLDGLPTADMSCVVSLKDSSPKSSKRRRRRSAKGHNDEDQKSLAGTSVMSNGSGSMSYRKPPLRTISELGDLRTNSADVSTKFDNAIQQLPGPMRLARHIVDDTQTSRKPHNSLSFQDTWPATEGDHGLGSC